MSRRRDFRPAGSLKRRVLLLVSGQDEPNAKAEDVGVRDRFVLLLVRARALNQKNISTTKRKLMSNAVLFIVVNIVFEDARARALKTKTHSSQ